MAFEVQAVMNTRPNCSLNGLQLYSGSADHSGSHPRRILIDCTHTVLSGFQTGIQRVVRSLVREAEILGRERGQSISGVMLGAHGFEEYHLAAGWDSPVPRPALRDNVLCHLPRRYVEIAEWMCQGTKSRKIRSWFLPKPGHLGIFKPAVKLIELGHKISGRDQRCENRLGLGEGDLLILPDAYWTKMEIWKHVRAARERGVFVVVVIHDAIPLTHPHFVNPQFQKGFRQYLTQAVANADLLVAVSQTVCDQLREELPQLLPELREFPPVEAFRNGADFEDKGQMVRDELVRLFEQSRSTPYLSVSTFDARKNYGFTLEAFEQLWSRGMDARIVFAGAQGWQSEALLDKIKAHSEFRKRLYVYHDLSDSELTYCYRRARGTISSSFVEGFGLPIVESLWHGRRTFASDTPIHREVGGNHVTYFDLASPEHLTGALAKWEAELLNGASIEQSQVRPMSWRESTALLLERCRAAYGAAGEGKATVFLKAA